MKKIIAMFFIVALLASSMNAQKPNMSFSHLTYDFGKIKETGGLATHKFEFTNTGAQPIIISNVTASCGCTTPDWSKQPVPPGGKGYVITAFDPRNRPDVFNKTVSVISNAANSPVTLTFTGEVLAKEQTIEDVFSFKMGDLRLKSNNVTFANIFNDETRTLEIEVLNVSAKNITLSFDKPSTPSHITIAANPATLAPNKTGKIVVTYDAKKKNDWDYVTDYIPLIIDGKKVGSTRLTVSATIKERFTKAVSDNPPIAVFTTNTFDFGTIKEGQNKSFEFTFKNTGKTDLILRKAKASCECIKVDIKTKILKPGQSGSIKVEYLSKGTKAKQNKLITILTNIPNEEKNRVILRVTGTVE